MQDGPGSCAAIIGAISTYQGYDLIESGKIHFDRDTIRLAAKSEDVLNYCFGGDVKEFLRIFFNIALRAWREEEDFPTALEDWLDTELKDCKQFRFEFC